MDPAIRSSPSADARSSVSGQDRNSQSLGVREFHKNPAKSVERGGARLLLGLGFSAAVGLCVLSGLPAVSAKMDAEMKRLQMQSPAAVVDTRRLR